ncbi:FecR family protein [Arenibacter nanhaiticus]|uniref:FecR family protein n=1 Tax=Arenibacter nanhaiticus TaxID=558155 RepID=A0A1M6MK44_9FLAO|nr:FecR family protein [Arenibacter nanhaiticus]SHJ83838.1 FecR family protein [Arenibacter nanhaiticus]
MNNKELENIIVKYLIHQASETEMDQLFFWLKDEQNGRLFYDYVQINYAFEHEMRQFDANKVKRKLEQLMAEEKKIIRLRTMRKIVGYAAVAVLASLLFTGYLLKDEFLNKPVEKHTKIVNNNIETGSNKATLTLGDGSQVALEKGNNYQIENAISDGEGIIYEEGEVNTSEIVYNFLTVPRGGQFHLFLSDGTEIWLNSESQLKYPVSFKKGQTREVELVYGEGYFDVSPSVEHESSKFIVINQSQKIEVLGTEFNLKAYKDESKMITTLIEGKVAVSTATAHKNLEPSQQATLNLKDGTMAVSEVDVYHEISWKEGVFSFRRKPLVEIMKVLSRWYDMDVNFQNSELENVGFNGVIDKDQNIVEILNTIKNLGIIKDYEVINKTIILK